MISNIQPEQQTIIERRGIIEPLFIQNEGVSERTNLQEMVPIARVACKPGDFQPQDQSYLPESNFGDEPLEAQAVDGGSSRVAQILINHDNALVCLSQRASSLTQRILAGGTFRVLYYLLQSTLTHIQTCQTGKMLSGDVLNHISAPPDRGSASA
jgi:hypothetical protein